MSRLLLALPVAAAVGCGSATADQATTAGAPMAVPQAPGVRVETAEVSRSDARLTLSLPGEVVGSRDALLGSAMGGFVEAVLVSSGEDVRKGQALARVNTRIYAAQRDQAEARLRLAEQQVERLESLGDLSAAAQLDAARADRDVAKAGLDLAQAQLSRSVISAPFTGRVAQFDLEAGEIANPGAPVARLVQLDPVEVSVSVSDKDVTAIRPGMTVQVSADSSGVPVAGVLTHVDPAADLRTRTFLAKVEVPNPDGRLLPGMIASVTIDQAVATEAVVVPQDWLVTRMDGVGVFKVGPEGRAVWHAVQPSLLVRDQVILDSGVEPGDQVVISGHRALADGDPLIIARTGSCCTAGRVTW